MSTRGYPWDEDDPIRCPDQGGGTPRSYAWINAARANLCGL